MNEPMSDERLAAARRNHAAYKASHAHAGSFVCCSAHASADDVPELLAEVERLRGELAAHVEPEPLTAEQLDALRDAMLRADALEAYRQTWTRGAR